ncbi:MAG: hypothetical protein Ta2B_23060 [Termitinemataceae bacterium]|nr:MAG: hypothetical protein Ta2B_23060 [Termitinemataceae bacterium]
MMQQGVGAINATALFNIYTPRKIAANEYLEVPFIKSDIEGAERDMLRGAFNVLQKFAPKLAICTYHLQDDPQVLKNIILQANPKYRIVQLRNKLLACV